ncbi:hypothetical protein NA57DRAFT_55673 [Rhizodiscina lignyota]|uniref:Uncharacterized protein n=1 Tax=Rhizodiscina lignyota TaxID=1504668 RepID=A0A9P4II46_9PEZI|nr:hypothetical protein NA57DRAFT_55673 [Rhizodiscina lignyota]
MKISQLIHPEDKSPTEKFSALRRTSSGGQAANSLSGTQLASTYIPLTSGLDDAESAPSSPRYGSLSNEKTQEEPAPPVVSLGSSLSPINKPVVTSNVSTTAPLGSSFSPINKSVAISEMATTPTTPAMPAAPMTPAVKPSVAATSVTQPHSRKRSLPVKATSTHASHHHSRDKHFSPKRLTKRLTEMDVYDDTPPALTSAVDDESESPIRNKGKGKLKLSMPLPDDIRGALADVEDEIDDEDDYDLDYDQYHKTPNNRQAKRKAQRDSAKLRTPTKSRAYPFPPVCMRPGCNQSDGINFRSCVLDLFGRNKKGTKAMKRWPLYCRKCYQQAAYNRAHWPIAKCGLVEATFQFIEMDDPGTAYTVMLRSSEQARLDKAAKMGFDAYIASGLDNAAELRQATPEEDKDGEEISISDIKHSRFGRESKPFKQAPIQILQDFLDNFGGKNKSLDHCREALAWLREQFEQGMVDDLPRVEFLPELERAEALKRTPARNKKTPASFSNTSARSKKRKTPSDDDADESDATQPESPEIPAKRVKAALPTPKKTPAANKETSVRSSNISASDMKMQSPSEDTDDDEATVSESSGHIAKRIKAALPASKKTPASNKKIRTDFSHISTSGMKRKSPSEDIDDDDEATLSESSGRNAKRVKAVLSTSKTPLPPSQSARSKSI